MLTGGYLQTCFSMTKSMSRVLIKQNSESKTLFSIAKWWKSLWRGSAIAPQTTLRKEWGESTICCDSKAARSHVNHLFSMPQHASITNGCCHFWLDLAKTWEQASNKSTLVRTWPELWCGQAKLGRWCIMHSLQLNSIPHIISQFGRL